MNEATAARYAGWTAYVRSSWGSATLHPGLYAVTRSAGYFLLLTALVFVLAFHTTARLASVQTKAPVTFE